MSDKALWALISTLHENIPEDDRPMAWSDFSDEQATRLKKAAAAFLNNLLNAPDIREAIAEIFYEVMSYEGHNLATLGKPNWITNGNSAKQDEARQYAKRVLNIIKGNK